MAQDNNNGFQLIEVRSNGLNLFGEEGNLLIISYLDESISLSLRAPYTDNEGKRTYPRDSAIPIILRKEVIMDLSYIIEKDILPKYEAGENFSKGVFLTMKKDSLLVIEGVGGVITLYYFKDIDETRRPKNTHSFKFVISTSLDRYNPETGDFELQEIQAQFYCFAHMIMNFDRLVTTKTAAHASKMGNAWSLKQEMDHLRAIASTVGATVEGARPYQNQNTNYVYQQNPSVQTGNDFTPGQMVHTEDLNGIFK